MKKIILMAFSMLILGGCTIGQSEFNCSRGDQNALCANSRTIYQATNGEIKEDQTITYIKDGEVHQTNLTELESIRNPKMKANSVVAQQVRPTDVPHRFSYDGQVLRQDVKVLRIWIAPFTDKQDDLNLSKLVYTDIEKRKWEIGDTANEFINTPEPSTDTLPTSMTNQKQKEHVYRPPIEDRNRMTSSFQIGGK